MGEAGAETLAVLEREDVFRVVAALISDERRRRRFAGVGTAMVTDERGATIGLPPAAWRDDTYLDERGIGEDSIALLGSATRVGEFFGLTSLGLDDYLSVEPRLGGWIDIVMHGAPRIRQLSFRSSGTSGRQQRSSHAIGDLVAEARLPEIGGGEGPVVAMVAPHHLYGFLFTVLAPRLTARPVIAPAGSPAGGEVSRAMRRAADQVVTTPNRLADGSVAAIAAGIDRPLRCLSSGSPLKDTGWSQAAEAGIEVIDLYGATETAGIGWRRAPGSFALLGHRAWAGDGTELVDSAGRPIAPPDRLRRRGQGFDVLGRHDGIVTVAGTNVDTSAVAGRIASVPGVGETVVTLDDTVEPPRLRAFVEPVMSREATGPDAEALATRIRRYCETVLPAAERPVRIDVVASLSRGSLGKALRDQTAAATSGTGGSHAPPGTTHADAHSP